MRSHRQKGISIIEFALVAPFLFVLMGGIVTIGMNLSRLIRVAQLARDAASMYVRAVDFSKTGNQDILVRLGETLGLARTGGDAVVYLTKVTFLPQSKCTELAISPCNGNQHVMTQRIVIGNGSLARSWLGTPTASLIDAQGLVRDYMREASAVARMPGLTLAEGEYAYVAETYAEGVFSSRGIYSRALF